MLFELSQSFYFEAAHTLRRLHDAQSSLRVHGHTYHAEVTLGGERDPKSGMVVDLALLRRAIADVRESLDHHLLDEVPGLGIPTLENLCLFIAGKLKDHVELPLMAVRVWREASADSCLLRL